MKTLNILHIEDSPEDSELIQHLLNEGDLPCEITRVETRAGVFDELEKNSYDLILADCKLPSFSGLRALEIAHALKPDVPFVFVSGTIGEETAIESLRNGATDYVLKERLTRLVPAVRRALAEAKERTMCRHLQQRLREAGRLEAISTLSHGIAHDFNNILTIILGHASLLNMERSNPARVQEISRTITEAGRRGSDIVQQLLAFARKSDGHVAPIDLNRYVEGHLKSYQEKIPASVELTFEAADALPTVMADAGQLDCILMNLLNNSVEAMPDGGNVTLSTKFVKASELPDLRSELESQSYIRLVVSDTGKGIDPASREHLFEPFFTTKERRRGTGLGLPVVYGLMQAHHGHVDLQSEIGHGTSVSLYFPVATPGEVTAHPLLDESDPALTGSETVLIVEDEEDVRFFLETMLHSYGYQTFSAADADQAMVVFREHRDEIRLVFSDIGLPRVDGIDLCLKLRELKPSLPLILASGFPFKDFKDRLGSLGPEVFISKPYNTRDILSTVRKTLDGSKVIPLAS